MTTQFTRVCSYAHVLRPGNGKGPEVLLGPRKSKFQDGIIAGGGGGMEKVDRGSILRCLSRELKEEQAVRANVRRAVHFATADYYHLFSDGPKPLQQVHFFDVPDWEGEPFAKEGFHSLSWYPLSDLPYESMFEDIGLWLPLVLKEREKPRQKRRILEIEIYYNQEELFRKVDRMCVNYVQKATKLPLPVRSMNGS